MPIVCEPGSAARRFCGAAQAICVARFELPRCRRQRDNSRPRSVAHRLWRTTLEYARRVAASARARAALVGRRSARDYYCVWHATIRSAVAYTARNARITPRQWVQWQHIRLSLSSSVHATRASGCCSTRPACEEAAESASDAHVCRFVAHLCRLHAAALRPLSPTRIADSVGGGIRTRLRGC